MSRKSHAMVLRSLRARQLTCGVIVAIVAICVAAVAARAESLELKNGSLINGKFMGGTQTSISFQVASSVQSYDIADVRSLRFDSDAQGASPSVPSKQPSEPSAIEKDEVAKTSSSVTISAGTRISVRTIDSIDSTKNRVGYPAGWCRAIRARPIDPQASACYPHPCTVRRARRIVGNHCESYPVRQVVSQRFGFLRKIMQRYSSGD